jgi:CRISPR/Cas system-associated exonuclease Cas4 (RecB family)
VSDYHAPVRPDGPDAGDHALNDFLTSVERLVSDQRRLCALLDLEKRRRGIAGDRLLFVGVSNVASVRWCPMKAVLRSRAEELMFFGAYLYDRLIYARLLGLIRELPHTDQGLLEAGAEVGMADVERLLRRLPARPEREAWAYREAVGAGGEVAWVLNPDLSAADRTHYYKLASRAGVRVLELEDDPKMRGLVLEEMRAERYPTIRWNFAWERYVVVGVPDGITGDLIYEFKTTRSRYLGGHLLPTALVQADLYGLFFDRKSKRVQLYIVEEDVTQTWDRPIDRSAAESILKEFRSVDEGRRPRPPRERWKCRRCDVRPICPVCPPGSA